MAELKENLTQKLPDGTLAVRLEAIEEYMDVAEKLEKAVNKISEIVNSKELDEALLDIYDPQREPASPFIVQAFLDIKRAIAGLT